eukprot:2992204-Pyramimonas_sp.AAC.1
MRASARLFFQWCSCLCTVLLRADDDALARGVPWYHLHVRLFACCGAGFLAVATLMTGLSCARGGVGSRWARAGLTRLRLRRYRLV